MPRCLLKNRSRGFLFLTAFLALGLFASAEKVSAQAGTIAGAVTSAQGGQQLSAAQIFISDLDIGVLSQANGRYLLLNVPAGTHTVTVNRIGYRVEEATVTVASGGTVVQDFTLTEEALQLDEVIVTGTAGGQQRRAIGNAVASVNVADVAATSAVRQIEDVLVGRTPGVHLQPSTGAGGGSKIRIRGHSSVGLAGDPIIYIDGVRLNNNRRNVGRYSNQSGLADFDMNNVESIEILKGPAAATLYGTEASDGVIQIVTKRGQTGAPVFEFGSELGANYWPDWEGYNRSTWTPNPNAGCTVATAPCTDVSQLTNFDPADHNRALGYKYPWQDGLIQRYNAAVRGGTDIIRYSFSVARTDEQGIVHWNSDERNSVAANIGVTPNEKVSIQLSGQYAQGVYHPPEFWWGGVYGWGSRSTSYYRTDGSIATCGGTVTATCPGGGYELRGWRNGGVERWDLDRYNNFTRSKRSTWSLQATVNPYEWLTSRVTVGLDQLNDWEERFISREGISFFHGSNGREGDMYIQQRDHPVWTLDWGTNATTRLMDDQLGSTTSVGAQYYTKSQYETFAHGEEFAIRALSTVSAAAQREGGQTFLENSTLGLYVQQQFDWQNRIFVTAAVRGDDNSAFGTNYEAAVYPKFSATWVLSEEDFWNFDFLDQFRLRSAWGKAGKQPDIFAATQLFFPQTGPGGASILTPDPSAANVAGTIGNPDLGPEVGQEIEIGFDASMFEGRVATSFTYYSRVTKDAIIPKTVPPSLWAPENNEPSSPVQFVNVGQTSNWGTEMTLNIQAITEGPARLDIDVAFTTQDNRIDDMGGIERIQEGRSRAHFEGYPIAVASDKRVMSADFVSGDRGSVTNIMCDGGTGTQITRSDGTTYGADFGGALVPCADAPRLVWGRTDPSRLLNVTPTFTILDDWRVSANFDAMWGHWMAHDYATARYTSHPTSKAVWLQDDPLAMGYIATTRNGFGFSKAGFLKLREISLGYNFPQSMADMIGASSANIRVGARNVARLWLQDEWAGDDRLKYDEPVSDPEIGRSVYNFAGEDGGGWPPIPQWTVRFGVTF